MIYWSKKEVIRKKIVDNFCLWEKEKCVLLVKVNVYCLFAFIKKESDLGKKNIIQINIIFYEKWLLFSYKS